MSNHQFNQHARIYDCSVVQDHVSIHIESMLRSMPPTSLEHSIFRVRHQLRKVNEKAYDPEVLAIGPYHYGNDKFKFMEKQKLRYLQQLLERRKESVDRYMPTLREMEQRACNCYAETIDLSQEKFLAMMLIDGCFIVELFRKYNNKIPIDEDDLLMHGLGIRNSIMRDLLLLENQLPLFVLSKLHDLTKDPGDESEFGFYARVYFDVPIQNWTIGEETEHLLHLYHTWHTSDLPKPNRSDCLLVCTPIKFSATELRDSRVKFKAEKGDQLSDIKFENETLEIAVLKVEDHTESKFRNLVAYEQHCRRRDINYFTDYVNFMDNLINSSMDVEFLRRAGIIENYLRDDKVVAQMFNQMGNHVAISNSYYCKIFQNVNAHCVKRGNLWTAKLRRDYFPSPRSFFSVFAGIVFFLTVAQTVFTILSYTK
ncbi:UPF0481 protein At3g47200 isoform X2 [Eucalyptus grandis]|uniref:UPF0481 protein At3g47200 isoform X2 n=1 Tax=Eucalyptus grandis TaxID=71139 RepID=UPI0008A0F65F|nr:UPF0481 protein At3g47200 isoform X2 [Eucalyptus grandis]